MSHKATSLCLLCKSTYNLDKSLPCAHAFCRNCLLCFSKRRSGEESGKITCPQCSQSRKTNDEPSDDSQSVLNSFSETLKLLDFVGNRDDTNNNTGKSLTEKFLRNRQYCKKHDGEQVKLYCENHGDVICGECLIDSNDHLSCRLKKITHATKQKSDALKMIAEQCGSELPVLRSELKMADQSLKQLNEKADLLTRKIKIAYERKELLNKRLKCLDEVKAVTSALSGIDNGVQLLSLTHSMKDELEHMLTVAKENRLALMPSNAASRKSEESSDEDISSPWADGSVKDLMPVHDAYSLFGLSLLHRFGRRGSRLKQFNIPTDVAIVESGHIAVVDSENNRLQIFDLKGNVTGLVTNLKSSPYREHFHSRIASIDGNFAIIVYEPLSTIFTVKFYDIYGSQCGETCLKRSAVFAKSLVRPQGLAFDSNRNIYVSDTRLNSILVFNREGTLVTTSEVFSSENEFKKPGYIDVDTHDNLHISDTRDNCVKIFNSKGKFLGKINSIVGATDGGSLRSPQGVACIGNQVLIADGGNNRVIKMSNTGTYLGSYLSKGDKLNAPRGLSMSSNGQLIVSQGHKGVDYEVRIYKL